MRFVPAHYERILDTYEALGLSRESAGLWCTPLRDAEVLIEHLEPQRHRKILEVGTYVGVSALLLALHAPAAEIHTVDPNLPLESGTPGRGVERSSAAGRRTLTLAAEAAARLGVADRVAFYAGGFTLGGDFKSRDGGVDAVVHSGDEAEVQEQGATTSGSLPEAKDGRRASRSKSSRRRAHRVVGPIVCQREGPFDFVFVDGLHYQDAVQGDLELIVEHLAPKGMIVLHDLIGLWGTHLRWAVHRFLERHPEFALRHEPYREIYQAIGSLRRRSELPADHYLPHRARLAGKRLLDEPRWQRHLLSAAWRERTRGPVIELRPAGAPSLAREALALGARESHQIAVIPGEVENTIRRLSRLRASRSELVLALGALDVLDDVEASALLEAVAARQGLAVLGFSPPGERGAAELHSRTLSMNLALLRQAGLRTVNDLSLDLEPFLLPYWTGAARQSSHCLHLFTAMRRSRKGDLVDTGLATPVLHGTDDAAAAIESRQIGVLFRDLLMQHVLGRMPPGRQPAAPTDSDAAVRAIGTKDAGAKAARAEPVGRSAKGFGRRGRKRRRSRAR